MSYTRSTKFFLSLLVDSAGLIRFQFGYLVEIPLKGNTKPHLTLRCIEHLQQELGVSKRRACRVIGKPISTQRYTSIVKDDEEILRIDIIRLATQYGRYRYRRVEALLKDAGWRINHKRIERI